MMAPIAELCPIGRPQDRSPTMNCGGTYRRTFTTVAKESEAFVPVPSLSKDSSKTTVPVVKEQVINAPKVAPTEKIKQVLGDSISDQQDHHGNVVGDDEAVIIPGLPDDVAKHCLALVPRCEFSCLRSVCKGWRKFIRSKEFYMVRTQAGMLEEWLYMLTADPSDGHMRWQAFDSVHAQWCMLPPMPGPPKTAFGYAVLNQKLIVIGGLAHTQDSVQASADVYQYDPVLNRWDRQAAMKEPRYEFGCAVVGDAVYAVGGNGSDGQAVASVEVYHADTAQWRHVEGPRRPRWGCVACGLQGRVYVVGGRSTLTIGHSRDVDVYDPRQATWRRLRRAGGPCPCLMVVAHAVLDDRLLVCIDWRNERQLAVFDAVRDTWQRVSLPLSGGLSMGFCLATFHGRLLLFSTKPMPMPMPEPMLAFDPSFVAATQTENETETVIETEAGTGTGTAAAVAAAEWESSGTPVRPSGICLCSVSITT